MKEVFICQDCPLSSAITVPNDEVDFSKIKLVLIGDTPAIKEGRNGKFLKTILDDLCNTYGLDTSEIYITSVVKCYPPKNRRPSKKEIEKCSYFLERELMQLKSNEVIIVCLGVIAQGWFRVGGSVINARNHVRNTKWGKVLVTWHPSTQNLFYTDGLGITDANRMVKDLENAVRWAASGSVYKTANVILVKDTSVIETMLNEVAGQKFALDFETTGLNIFGHDFEVVCYGVGCASGNNYIVDPREVGEEQAKKILQALWMIGTPIMFNSSFDMVIAHSWGGCPLKDDVEDLQVLYFLVNGGKIKNFRLKTLAIEFTDYGDYGLEQEEIAKIGSLPKEKTWAYCATDVRVTYDIYDRLIRLLKTQENLAWSEVFGETPKSLLDAYMYLNGKGNRVISELKANGMKVDLQYLTELKEKLESDIDSLQKRANELEGKINLNSSQQVKKVLEKRGINIDSTSKDILNKYIEKDEFVKILIDYRESMKLYTTYVMGLIEKSASSKDGLIHANFSLINTATGRLASSDPNLMNIPTRKGGLIEKAFISRFGDEGIIIKADMSQHELRVAALYSQDDAMIESYNAGKDLHTEVAMKVYGLKEEELGTPRAKELRRLAKGFNFGIVYGRGPASLAEELGISKEKAYELRDQYFVHFKKLSKWLERVLSFANKYQYVRTMFGRVRYLNISNDKEEEYTNVSSIAVNTPIQGAASDISLNISYEIIKKLEQLGFQSKVVNFIHDAVLIDCYLPEFEQIKNSIKEIVRDIKIPFPKLIPFEIDIVHGKNWGDCKD